MPLKISPQMSASKTLYKVVSGFSTVLEGAGLCCWQANPVGCCHSRLGILRAERGVKSAEEETGGQAEKSPFMLVRHSPILEIWYFC